MAVDSAVGIQPFLFFPTHQCCHTYASYSWACACTCSSNQICTAPFFLHEQTADL